MNNFIRIYDININKHIDGEYSYKPSMFIDVPIDDLKIFKKGLISYNINQEYVNTFEFDYYIHNDDKLKIMYIYLNLIKNFVFQDVILYSELFLNGAKYCSGYTIIKEYTVENGAEFLKLFFSTEDVFLWNLLKTTNLRTFGYNFTPKENYRNIGYVLTNTNAIDNFINNIVNDYNTEVAIGLVDNGEGFTPGKYDGDNYINTIPATFYIHNAHPHWKIIHLMENIFHYCGRKLVFDEDIYPIFENMVLIYNNKERKYPISLISSERIPVQAHFIDEGYMKLYFQPDEDTSDVNYYNPYRCRDIQLKAVDLYKPYEASPIERRQKPIKSVRLLHNGKYSLSYRISFQFILLTDIPPNIWPDLKLYFKISLIKGKSMVERMKKLSTEYGDALTSNDVDEKIIKEMRFSQNQYYILEFDNFTFEAEEGDYLVMYFTIENLNEFKYLIESTEYEILSTVLSVGNYFYPNFINIKEITSDYEPNSFIELPEYEKSLTLRKFFDNKDYENISLYDFVTNFLKTYNLYIQYDSKQDIYVISSKNKYYKNSKIIDLNKYNIDTYSIKYYKDVSRYNIFSFSGINIDKKTLKKANEKTRPTDYGYVVIKNNKVSLLNYNDDVNIISNNLFEPTSIGGTAHFTGISNLGYMYWIKTYNDDKLHDEYKQLIKNGSFYKRICYFGSILDYEFDNKFMFGYYNPFTYGYFPVLKYHRVCYIYLPEIQTLIENKHYYVSYGSIGNRLFSGIAYMPGYPPLDIYDSQTIRSRLFNIYPSITTIKNFSNEIYDENFLINYGPNSFLPYIYSFDNLQYPRNIYSVFFEPFYMYNFEYNYIEFNIKVNGNDIQDFINAKFFVFNGKIYVVDEMEYDPITNEFFIKMIKIDFENDEDFNPNNLFKEKPVKYWLSLFYF